ncbi:MAG: hypothetical protein QXJ92_02270 [Candidatus Pacearchaeota archaeon]
MRKKLAAIIFSLALAGFVGCAGMRSQVSWVKSYYKKYYAALSSKENYSKNLKKLEEDEYVLPNDVFEAYAKIVMGNYPLPPEQIGGYINVPLNSKNYEKFRNALKDNYSEQEIALFYSILSKKGNIIIKEKALDEALNDPDLDTILIHERTHKEFDKLSNKEKNKVCKVHELFKQMKNPDGTYFLNFKRLSMGFGNFIELYANCDEFFPFLVTDSLRQEVEQELRKYPDVYKIFEKIKAKVKK